ncbi:MAG: FecR domain-containing protein, partial [Chitinophagaceae bacterium]|nr:FecR domain-containing protein [Chitinophagaceae bacterium]
MDTEIFEKIFTNRASEKEKEEFFHLLENDPEKQMDYYRLKNLYVVSSIDAHKYTAESRTSFKNFWNLVQQSKRKTVLNGWMRYAAIFILALSIGFMANYLLNSNPKYHTEYSSQKGSVSRIKLPDGSDIWLSSGTNLIIDQNEKGEMVAKLDGEAYFNLIPDTSRRFRVDLGSFQVKDIGTSFNIRAYQSEPTIVTTLVEGRIELLKNSGEVLLSVMPGELVKYNKQNNQMLVNQQDPSVVIAWKDGKFVFIDQPLAEICKELENWYDIEIQIEDQKLAETR